MYSLLNTMSYIHRNVKLHKLLKSSVLHKIFVISVTVKSATNFNPNYYLLNVK